MSESETEFIDFDKVCRVCLNSSGKLQSIFQYKQDDRSPVVDLSGKMRLCHLTVDRGDGLPSQICGNCYNVLKVAYYWTRMTIQSHERLQAIQSKITFEKGTNMLEKQDIVRIIPQARRKYYKELICSVAQDAVSDVTKWDKDDFISDDETSDVGKTENLQATHHIQMYYLCTCSERFSKLTEYRQHAILGQCVDLNKAQKFKCFGCKKVWQNFDLWKSHEESECPNFLPGSMYKCTNNCKTSRSVFSTRFDYEVHQWRHRRMKLPQPQYQCGECKRVFKAKNTLLCHMDLHQNTKKFRCKLCGKSVQSSGALDVHLRSHTGERPYECKHCLYTAQLRNALIGHMIRKHGYVTKHKCLLCDKFFVSHLDMKTHVLAIHQGERPHSCARCGVSYRWRRSLVKHLQSSGHQRSPSL